MRSRSIVLLILAALPLSPVLAETPRHQDIVVIVNPASGVRALTKEQVIDIFMGRFRQLPSGKTALPIDLASTAERALFYEQLIHWTLAEVGSYWARLIFSGQANPPARAPDARAAITLVADNPGAIAYVERSAVTARVRVALDLGAP